jgi:transcriptional regulator with XRE-family HTH domain
MTREIVAVGVGRSYALEVRWERDFAVPTANDIVRLAEVLGVNVGELFGEVPAGAVA